MLANPLQDNLDRELRRAAGQGQFSASAEHVARLLKQGANANAVSDEENYTALHMAAIWGGEYADAIMEALLGAGAQVDARCLMGATPTFWCALMEAQARSPHMPVRCMQLLLAHGADPNGVDQDGVSALMLAAEAASAELVQLLLASGANVQQVSIHGDTALHRAARSENSGAGVKVRLLLEAGANLDLQDGEQKRPIDLARFEARRAFEEWVLEKSVAPGPVKAPPRI